LQPYLAVYGLAMCVLQGMPSSCIQLTIVLFQGYLVFARAKLPIGTSWVPTVMPWVTLGVLALLTVGWYFYGGIFTREWDWKIPSLRRVDVFGGAAPLVQPDEKLKVNWFLKGGRWILNKI
jgi:energy-coupling factor transporter transmembrane protein EcfT